MLNYQATAFEELIKPLSRGKLLLLLQVTDAEQCDQIDYYQAVLKGIGVNDGSGLMEDFMDRGFLKFEAGLSDESKRVAGAVVDYFRQKRFKDVIQASLFVDAQLLEHSGDGGISAHDVIAEIGYSGQVVTPVMSC